MSYPTVEIGEEVEVTPPVVASSLEVVRVIEIPGKSLVADYKIGDKVFSVEIDGEATYNTDWDDDYVATKLAQILTGQQP
jgi:hypothetical protein